MVNLNEEFTSLVEKAKQMGCEVIFDSQEPIRFTIDMQIYIPFSSKIDNLYAFAHEIGHLVDYINKELDYDKYISDWSYRVHTEMSAWVHAYNILNEIGVPLDGWKKHVGKKLFTHFKHKRVK